MAGEALLYLSNTSVILVDEPSTQSVDQNLLRRQLKQGLAIAKAGILPALDLRNSDDYSGPFLADETLLARIAEMGRSGLVVCGGLLEGAVTQLSLAALMNGLDVFVVVDLVSSAEPEKASLFLSRITSCGGHTLSYRQVILELLSGERQQSRRSPLEALLE